MVVSHSPSSQELYNGYVLTRLVLEGGAMALRRVFDSIHPPRVLANHLNENYVILESLLRQRVLNEHHWRLLFPPTGNPSSSRFDITLLFCLLRSISGLSPPVTGWREMPLTLDHSLEADIVRIKFFRNQFFHGERDLISGVDTPTFSTLSRELCSIYRRCDLPEVEIKRRRGNPFRESEEPKRTKDQEIQTERPPDTWGELGSISTHSLVNEGKSDK